MKDPKGCRQDNYSGGRDGKDGWLHLFGPFPLRRLQHGVHVIWLVGRKNAAQQQNKQGSGDGISETELVESREALENRPGGRGECIVWAFRGGGWGLACGLAVREALPKTSS